MPVLLDAVRQGQPLMQADVLDSEASRRLQHRIRDLLVVDAPRFRRVAERQACVALPGADLELVRPTPPLVEGARAFFMRNESLRGEPLRRGPAGGCGSRLPGLFSGGG